MGVQHKTTYNIMTMEKNAWKDVTLDEFTQIRAILADKGRDDEDKMVALAAVLQGVDEDTILDMPLDEVAPVFELVRSLDSAPVPNSVRRSRYQVGKWSLIASDRKMSVAQWIDFKNYAMAGMEDHLADILSVVLVPIGKTYNEGYDMDELKRALGGMTIGDALSVCFFFRTRFLRSSRRILTFLTGWAALKGQKELRRTSIALRREISAMLRSRSLTPSSSSRD